MTTTIEGELEIDHVRGVIYFHNKLGYSTLRICNLPTPIPSPPKRVREFAKRDVKPLYQLDYDSGREEIERLRMQILKLKPFVVSVSVITEHRCPSCDAIDVVEKAIKELEIHEV